MYSYTYASNYDEKFRLRKIVPASLCSNTTMTYRSMYIDAATRKTPDDVSFLRKAGVLVADSVSGTVHPITDGLLLLGYSKTIREVLPFYHVEYREEDKNGNTVFRFTSDEDDWSGNLLDFYLRIIEKAPIFNVKVVREFLLNAIIHADYRKSGGVVVVKTVDSLVIMNRGSFMMNLDEALKGGSSNPENPRLINMFMKADLANRAGYGLNFAFANYREEGFRKPILRINRSLKKVTVVLENTKQGH